MWKTCAEDEEVMHVAIDFIRFCVIHMVLSMN